MTVLVSVSDRFEEDWGLPYSILKMVVMVVMMMTMVIMMVISAGLDQLLLIDRSSDR
eukprot:COSAG05_NODE_1995_length_3729_cov_4.415427_5_plen_57_part_00